MMTTVRETQKRYCSRAMITAIAAGFACMLLGQIPTGKGLILGTFFSIVNFIVMAETISARLGKTKHQSVVLSFGLILFRYAILAVPLVIALKNEQFNLIAVVFGIFMIQIMILSDQFIGSIPQSRKKRI